MTKIGLDQSDWMGWDFEKLRRFWAESEAMGYDSFWVMDNVVWYDNITHKDMPVHEAWTTLAAMALETNQVRLGTMVTPARRRHPALLAKTCATIDAISDGRLNVGLGTGDSESHFELWGMELPSVRERIAILREEVEILKQLWTQETVTHQGKYYELNDAPCNPRPIQHPHPPIWMGLVLGRTLMPQLASKMADGVSVYTCSDVAAEQHLHNLARYCSEVGRDFTELELARNFYVYISEDEEKLPEIEQDLAATLEQQVGKVKEADNLDLAYEQVTRRYVIGTPAKVAEELCIIRDTGFDHLILIGLNTLDDLKLFADRVLPVVKN